jgi:hypothetical protein
MSESTGVGLYAGEVFTLAFIEMLSDSSSFGFEGEI